MTRKKQEEPNNKKTRKKNKGKNKKKIWLYIIIAIVILGIIATGAVFGMALRIIRDTEPVDAISLENQLHQNSELLERNGNLIETIGNIESDPISFNEMPKLLRDAIIAIEDERFYSHNGLDFRRIIGAAWTNLRTGSRQGASTLNQQIAKNLHLQNTAQTYERKIQDMYTGVMIDRALSKDQILQLYLNHVYLGAVKGHEIHGVQAAAKSYFNKDIGELELAQFALIAGIPRHPARYTPVQTISKENVQEGHFIIDDSDSTHTIVFRESSLSRQKLVLDQMKRLGYITQQQYTEALDFDIRESIDISYIESQSNVSSYFADRVRVDVLHALQTGLGYAEDEARTLLSSGGLRIYTTLDPDVQNILEEELKNFDYPAFHRDFLNRLDNKGHARYERDENGVVRDKNSGIHAMQSAMVITNKQGEIVAMMGGREDYGRRVDNRAIQHRSPGSSIKPVAVYAPALEMGYTAGTVIDDVPIPPDALPGNVFDRYRGLMPLRDSLAWSSNVVAHRLGDEIGPQTMVEYMEKMGMTRVSGDVNLSTALGGMTYGVSPLEMTAAYNAILNGGVYTEPITFTHITDREGNVIYENKPLGNRVLSPQASYVLTSMMESVITTGGAPGRISNMPVAGKTGTHAGISEPLRTTDLWFAGFTPYYTATTWIGTGRNEAIDGNSWVATRLWQNVMSRIHAEMPHKSFERPDGLVYANICTRSGKLATELCADAPGGSTVRNEVFIRGTEPTEYCDVHVEADIHVPSGTLATELTPMSEVETRIFIRRPIPYNPADFPGVTHPNDIQYELPTEYYDPFNEEHNPSGRLPSDEDESDEDESDEVEDSEDNNGIDDSDDDIEIIENDEEANEPVDADRDSNDNGNGNGNNGSSNGNGSDNNSNGNTNGNNENEDDSHDDEEIVDSEE
ncbi:transglycosylase domain-containing protein [Serpentinicella sp. ANB-PHB4]|uniref:transglycosylase domain-containing protein n=1 Tax=Serpentinicella sp. ANB-PHB4 TaxID=3074076 RepID=UPI002860C075|nr:transglycosylase domain-containing protein [Serpentinicella sp. ANB-PHB4]MDR5660080.1 transglycosylase domain-containing protein [Serpentinicella sp. ANB-PHB4]